MPRFVILTHDHPFLHWDLMLEQGDSLRTWRLEREADVGDVIPAEELARHRLAYLTYEGPVSGNRGSVARWDAGEYELLRDEPDLLEVHLDGHRVSGIATLVRNDGRQWSFARRAGSHRPSP